MNWITRPVILEGARVRLEPLAERHFDELIKQSSPAEIWTHLSINGDDPETLRTTLKSALLKKISGEEYPFIIIDKLTGGIIGCTRYMEMMQEHRKLEIGWTWYIPSYWATGYNTECKLLLLTYAFETLNAVRVQLKTSGKNLRSQAAIKKIGAIYEGTLRKARIGNNGEVRDTAMFSIIDEEWSGVKQMLAEKIQTTHA
jgi:RimJ/RimL family protein N-acetyltransferase